MQPLNEILKEIGLPIWICWGASVFAIVMAFICAASRKSTGVSWLSVLPLPGTVFAILMMGIIIYSANDSIKRRKAWDQERARYAGELAAIKAVPVLEEKKTITL